MLVDNISEWNYITLIYTTDCNSWTIRWSMLTKRKWRKEKTANLVSGRKAELYNCRLWKRLTTDLIWYYRSSYLEVFCRKGTLKKFREIHRKTPVPEPLFNKVAGLRPETLLKKRLWHRPFPVNFAKFLRTPFFIGHLRWLLLTLWRTNWADCKRIFCLFVSLSIHVFDT